MMKKMLCGLVLFECVNVTAMDGMQERTYGYSESYKTAEIQGFATEASSALQEAQENPDVDTSLIKKLIVRATESPEALEKLTALACNEQTDLDGAMKLWEISSSTKDYNQRKQEEINKVTAMIGSILSDWCCGHALEPEEYLSYYYNGWFTPLVSDDNAK